MATTAVAIFAGLAVKRSSNCGWTIRRAERRGLRRQAISRARTAFWPHGFRSWRGGGGSFSCVSVVLYWQCGS